MVFLPQGTYSFPTMLRFGRYLQNYLNNKWEEALWPIMLFGNGVIDPVTCHVSHGMKLWVVVLDSRSSINLRYDLPSHLCWGIIEPCSVLHRTYGVRHLSSGFRHYSLAYATMTVRMEGMRNPAVTPLQPVNDLIDCASGSKSVSR
ncbi:hypothetical protein JCGZ_05965 [Jatropha curcas]|uniref:Uncharacterized protein n=1 Tax=Jatropha curcas TaxID=180498 RepID=A0A067KMQ6_JATCU|nr:hypothetical protein JCGZ_05965 [Jatropha curcas]